MLSVCQGCNGRGLILRVVRGESASSDESELLKTEVARSGQDRGEIMSYRWSVAE